MSTRRARIKAVTSLPPRRKNADKNGNKNDKPDTDNNVEKIQQQSTDKDNAETLNSTKLITDGSGDKNAHETSRRNVDIESIKSPKAKVSNTVSVIRSNVFVSPQKRSPRRTFASPIAPSPKIAKNLDGNKSISQKAIGTPINQKINDCDELQISDNLINKIQYTEDTCNKDVVGNSPQKLDTSDEAVMDGIVPLQPESHLPKPIDLLKNDIISENAEVLFDPIIPLPSHSKVRPKLRPVPRLGPHRRNSIQGSASESEDESRRGLASVGPSTPGPQRSLANIGPSTPAPHRQRYDSHTSISTLQSLPNRDISRVRNDSICSTTSQITMQQFAASPIKEKQATKTRRPEVSRRMMASKRRRETVKREAMTMYDLIFYNPSTNPIVPDDDELKASEETEKEIKDNCKEEKEKEAATKPPEEESTPVPQIKLGPNGEIMLDESSLVIKRTAPRAAVGVAAWGGGGRYRRAARSADWSAAETVRFYRALGALGTDFTLMAPLFPDRTRKELKIKFKKEEKVNGAQVDRALRAAAGWDVGRLRDEFRVERAQDAARDAAPRLRLAHHRTAERARLRDARSVRVRTSMASKAMESTMLPGVSRQIEKGVITVDDIVEKATQSKTVTVPVTPTSMDSNLATLTLIKKGQKLKTPTNDTAISKSTEENPLPKVPANIESGSLVVLTVNDPSSPGKKMLQTYIAHGPHKLTPVALPATFLNSVVGYMQKNAMKGSSSASSPLMSPNSVTSQDSRTSGSSTTHDDARAASPRLHLAQHRTAERARLSDARSVRVRTSRASKAIESTMLPGVSRQIEKGVITVDDIVEKAVLHEL